MPTVDPTQDLNKVIVHAVNAQVEAEMMKALSGDETIGSYVTAALRQQVKKSNDPYASSRDTEPYLTHVLRSAIQEAAKAAVQKLLVEELPLIEDEVRKALRRDVKQIAEGLAKSLSDVAARGYGIDVKLDLRVPNRD